jgi:ketosteroid isomerase-like protein
VAVRGSMTREAAMMEGSGGARPAAAAGLADPAAIATAYFMAVNERRWDDLAALFHDDAELRPVGSRPRIGRDDVAAYYPPLLAGFATSFDDPRALHVADDVVTAEIAFTGTTVGGREVAFDAVDVFRIRDGRISSLRILYDILDVIRQTRDEA